MVFEHRDYLARVTLRESDISTEKKEAKPQRYPILIEAMRFDIAFSCKSREKEDSYHQLFTDMARKDELIDWIAQIINRVVRAIRCWGLVPNLRELRPRADRGLDYLGLLSAEFALDDDFKPLGSSKESSYWARRMLNDDSLAAVDMERWPRICEAIQKKRVPAPSQEFVVNALEFLRQGNMRLAIVESIVALEIATSNLLHCFLREKRKLSQRQIIDFLRPQLDLIMRITGVMPLILDEYEVEEIAIEDLRRVIKWRNDMVHTTGRPPADASEAEMEKCINSVLQACNTFTLKTRQAKLEVPLDGVAQEIADGLGSGLYVNISTADDFIFEATISRAKRDIIGSGEADEIVRRLGERLKEIEDGFDPKEHLYVRFYNDEMKLLAKWQDGSLEQENDCRSL